LSGNALFLNGARELARALEGGAGKNLRRLDLHAVGLETEGMREIALALKRLACPELMGLGLALNRIGHQGAVALGEAMAGGGLAQLVGLEVHKNELGDEGVMAITNVLVAGACPLLLYLGMSTSRASDVSVRVLVEGIRSGPGLARLERLNLQDNWISKNGLARLQEMVAVVAARGGRLRLEVSGNGARQILRREAGWLLNGTRRICVGLVVGGGAVLGALAIKMGRRWVEAYTEEDGFVRCWKGLVVRLVLLLLGGVVIGLAQSCGLVRAWEQAPGSGNAAAAADDDGGEEEGEEEEEEEERSRVPNYIIWAILAGDAVVAATGGWSLCWWDVALLFLWTGGVIVGFGIALDRAGY